MEKKEKLEVRRQIFHLLLGVAIVILYSLEILTINMLFAIFFIGFVISLASRKCKIPVIHWFLKNFEREKEFKENPGKGTLMYIAGVLIALLLFKESIALAAIMILAVGDSVAHMIGKYFGRYRLKNAKHIEGTVAGIFFASVAASMFVKPTTAFLASTVAMVAEAVELRIGRMIIDDNLAIPVIAGLTIHLLQLV